MPSHKMQDPSLFLVIFINVLFYEICSLQKYIFLKHSHIFVRSKKCSTYDPTEMYKSMEVSCYRHKFQFSSYFLWELRDTDTVCLNECLFAE